MNILSLFDGISCGQVALNRAGIPYANYYASEIDKHAIKVTQGNYPNTKQVGDIYSLDLTTLSSIDLLLGGSPCKSFSSIGKQGGFLDEQGKLFYEFVRVKNIMKPKYFLFENVPMKKENQDTISSLLEVEPLSLNSNIFSAQNRKRLYWTNIPLTEEPCSLDISLDNVIDLSLQIEGPPSFKKYLPANPGTYIDPYNKRNIYNKSTSLRTNINNGNMWVLNKDKKTYRNLTVGECELLQTLPLNFTREVSACIAKKLISNGWTVDVIVHILKNLKDNR